MSPQEFTFKLSVPNDPSAVEVVIGVAHHAAEYAALDAGKAKAFVDRARATAAQVIKGGAGHCAVVFAAANGQLTMTVGGQSVSEALSA